MADDDMEILERALRQLLDSTEPTGDPRYREVVMDVPTKPTTWRVPGLHPRTAAKLYEATSFLTWQYGLHFNAHLNIGFSSLGLDGPDAAAAMARFNKEAMRRLSVGGPGRRLPDGRPRCGAPHHYVYVIEYGAKRGLHAHLLCVLPPGMKRTFERFAQRWWAKEAGLIPACDRCRYPEVVLPGQPPLRPGSRAARQFCPGSADIRSCMRHGLDTIGRKMPEDAVMLVAPPPLRPTKAHERQFAWLRYILKTTFPGVYWLDIDGSVRRVEEVLRLALREVPREGNGPVRVCVPQMHGISQSLLTKAQTDAGFQSWLRPGAFDQVYSGWELQSYRTRQTVKTLKL